MLIYIFILRFFWHIMPSHHVYPTLVVVLKELFLFLSVVWFTLIHLCRTRFGASHRFSPPDRLIVHKPQNPIYRRVHEKWTCSLTFHDVTMSRCALPTASRASSPGPGACPGQMKWDCKILTRIFLAGRAICSHFHADFRSSQNRVHEVMRRLH